MGILKGLLGVAERIHRAKDDVEYALVRDRRFDRAEALAKSGAANEAVVTGIRRRLNDGTTDTEVRLEWYTPEPRAGGLEGRRGIRPGVCHGPAAAEVRTIRASINYTLSTEGRGTWPQPFLDVEAAASWVQAHAGDYGAGGSRLAAGGDSAGAHWRPY